MNGKSEGMIEVPDIRSTSMDSKIFAWTDNEPDKQKSLPHNFAWL